MSLLSARAPKINFADESRRGLLRRANRVSFSPLVTPPTRSSRCSFTTSATRAACTCDVCACVCVYLRECSRVCVSVHEFGEDA